MTASTPCELRIEPGRSHLLGAGRSAWSDGQAHHHDGCELLWLRAGHLRLRIRDTALALGAGAILLIGPNIPHQLEEAPPPELSVVHFLAERSPLSHTEAWSSVRALARQASRGLHLNAAEVPPALAQALERLQDDGDLAALTAFLSLLDALTRAPWRPILAEGAANEPPGSAPSWMQALCARIDTSLTEPLRLRELCRLSGIGRSALCAAFTRHLGCGPMSWVARRRLERAAALLLRSDRQVLTVALDSGFTCLSTFNRRFTALHGVPPARWRQLRAQQAAPDQPDHAMRVATAASGSG